ncbi:histidine kinase dimerization/phosphoacceptor domain -containing protein [Bradyrhizobium sp. CAR08]
MWNCCDSRGRRSRHDVPHTPAGLDRRGTFCSRSSHIERGNDLATIVSILRLQARSETDPGVQRAIASAVSRVDVAKVHDRLRETADTSRIALAPDIESLCASLADFHRGVRTISIRVRCEDIWVRSSQAASIGLIVNELLQVRISGGPPRLGGGRAAGQGNPRSGTTESVAPRKRRADLALGSSTSSPPT